MTLTEEAVTLAEYWHRGQHRKNEHAGVSLPYIVHPIEVAKLVHSWGAGEEVCAAAVLHDLREDTECPDSDILSVGGPAVLSIVKELTFTGGRKDKQAYLDKLALTCSTDAFVIKIADRLCNVKDFYDDGSVDYARKYYLKANPLWHAMDKRVEELEKFRLDKILFNKQSVFELLFSRSGVDTLTRLEYNRVSSMAQ